MRFKVRFIDAGGDTLKLKPHDTITYQYMSGLPGVYPPFEDELQPVVGPTIGPESYCIAEVQANKGTIKRCTVELRFERSTTGLQQDELFSKSPFSETTHGYANEPDWGPGGAVRRFDQVEEENAPWYEVYKLGQSPMDGRTRIMWRPARRRQ
jgi:hypothetical protein